MITLTTKERDGWQKRMRDVMSRGERVLVGVSCLDCRGRNRCTGCAEVSVSYLKDHVTGLPANYRTTTVRVGDTEKIMG